jgi:hypothetical protein
VTLGGAEVGKSGRSVQAWILQSNHARNRLSHLR